MGLVKIIVHRNQLQTSWEKNIPISLLKVTSLICRIDDHAGDLVQSKLIRFVSDERHTSRSSETNFNEIHI